MTSLEETQPIDLVGLVCVFRSLLTLLFLKEEEEGDWKQRQDSKERGLWFFFFFPGLFES